MSIIKIPSITLMGPTATGKTELAIALAQEFPVEIISVDSALVYRGMDIGTAKPDFSLRQQIPHHLIDIISVEENYSVAAFLKDTAKAVQEISGRGKIPLFVGGTMLYFKALVEGLADIPVVPHRIRESLKQRLLEQGLPSLYQLLQQIDAKTSERLHANDAQRILRALEVYEASGKPLSVWLAQSSDLQQVQGPLLQLGLVPEDRQQLHYKLAERFHVMLERGFVEEVAALQTHYSLTAESAAMRCVGYRQVWQYLAGQMDYAAMVDQGISASRQLAKRQLTWLRSWRDQQLVFAYQPDTMCHIKMQIQRFLSHAASYHSDS